MRGQDGGAQHRRPVTEGRRLDGEVSCGEGKRPFVHHRPNASQEVVLQTRQGAAQDDAARVVEAHERRQHLADALPGDADKAQDPGVACLAQAHDVNGMAGIQALRGELASQSRAGGDRLEAVQVAAGARHVGVHGHPDVADVARGAVRCRGAPHR